MTVVVYLWSTVGELPEDFGGGANTGSAGGCDLPWRPLRLSKGGGRGRADLQGNLGLWRRKLSGVMPRLNELHPRQQSKVSKKKKKRMVAAKGGGTLTDLQLHKMGKVRFRNLFRNRSKENYIQFEIEKQVSPPRSKHRNVMKMERENKTEIPRRERHMILNLGVSLKVLSGFYLRSWQRRPSGKQSLPVPLSGSLPQSSGNSGSFPVATGASVPSSTNLGRVKGPRRSLTAVTNGCKKLVNPWKAPNGNWALAAGRRIAAKRKHWSLMMG